MIHPKCGPSFSQRLWNRQLHSLPPFSLPRELMHRNLTEGRCHEFAIECFGQEIAAFCMNGEILCAHDKQNLFFYQFLTGEKRVFQIFPGEDTATFVISDLFEIVEKTLLLGLIFNNREKCFVTVDLSNPSLPIASKPKGTLPKDFLFQRGGSHIIAVDNAHAFVWDLDGTIFGGAKLEATPHLYIGGPPCFASEMNQSLHTEVHSIILKRDGFYALNRQTGASGYRSWGEKTNSIHGCWVKNSLLVASITSADWACVSTAGAPLPTMHRTLVSTLRVFNLESDFFLDYPTPTPFNMGNFFSEVLFFWQQDLSPIPQLLHITDLTTGQTTHLIEDEKEGVHRLRYYNEKEGLLVLQLEEEKKKSIFKIFDLTTRMLSRPILVENGADTGSDIQCEAGRVVLNWESYLRTFDYNVVFKQETPEENEKSM